MLVEGKSAHNTQAPPAAFWACLFVQEEIEAGEKEELLGRLLLQCAPAPPEAEQHLCSQDDAWCRASQARLVFPLLPSSLLIPGCGSAAVGSS